MLNLAFLVVAIAALFLVGTRALGSRGFGLIAAALLISTPLLYQMERPGLPLAALVVWLWCLWTYADRRAPVWLLAAGAALGAGMYASSAAFLMMPIYLALSIAWLLLFANIKVVALLWMLGGFVVTAAGAFRRPADLVAEVTSRHIYDAASYGLVRGLRELVSWVGLTARSGIYFDYFNPAFLFLAGKTFSETLMHPLVFLLPLILLVPFGIYRIAKRESTRTATLIFVGALLTPAAACLTDQFVPRRIVLLVPFVALMSAYGAQELLTSPWRSLRWLGWIVLASVPICFAVFAFSAQ